MTTGALITIIAALTFYGVVATWFYITERLHTFKIRKLLSCNWKPSFRYRGYSIEKLQWHPPGSNVIVEDTNKAYKLQLLANTFGLNKVTEFVEDKLQPKTVEHGSWK
jgi:hypothetical protein